MKWTIKVGCTNTRPDWWYVGTKKYTAMRTPFSLYSSLYNQIDLMSLSLKALVVTVFGLWERVPERVPGATCIRGATEVNVFQKKKSFHVSWKSRNPSMEWRTPRRYGINYCLKCLINLGWRKWRLYLSSSLHAEYKLYVILMTCSCSRETKKSSRK